MARVFAVDPVPLRAAGADTEAEMGAGCEPSFTVEPTRSVVVEAASSPTRRLLLSALGFSVTIFIVGLDGAEPNPGEW